MSAADIVSIVVILAMAIGVFVGLYIALNLLFQFITWMVFSMVHDDGDNIDAEAEALSPAMEHLCQVAAAISAAGTVFYVFTHVVF